VPAASGRPPEEGTGRGPSFRNLVQDALQRPSLPRLAGPGRASFGVEYLRDPRHAQRRPTLGLAVELADLRSQKPLGYVGGRSWREAGAKHRGSRPLYASTAIWKPSSFMPSATSVSALVMRTA